MEADVLIKSFQSKDAGLGITFFASSVSVDLLVVLHYLLCALGKFFAQ